MQRLDYVCLKHGVICGTEPHPLEYVVLSKKYAVAMNMYSMIAHKTKAIFDPDFVDSIPEDQEYMIHHKLWAKLCLSKISWYRFNPQELTITSYDKKNKIVNVINVEHKGNRQYPNWKNIIPNTNVKLVYGLHVLGIDPQVLYNLQCAIYPEKSWLAPVFLKMSNVNSDNTTTSAIVVKSLDGIYQNKNFHAIIMPVKLIEKI